MNFSAGKQYVSVSVCKENKDDYNEVFFYLLASSKSSSQERRFSKLRSPGGENIREVVECSHSAKNQQRDLENIEETRDWGCHSSNWKREASEIFLSAIEKYKIIDIFIFILIISKRYQYLVLSISYLVWEFSNETELQSYWINAPLNNSKPFAIFY